MYCCCYHWTCHYHYCNDNNNDGNNTTTIKLTMNDNVVVVDDDNNNFENYSSIIIIIMMIIIYHYHLFFRTLFSWQQPWVVSRVQPFTTKRSWFLLKWRVARRMAAVAAVVPRQQQRPRVSQIMARHPEVVCLVVAILLSLFSKYCKRWVPTWLLRYHFSHQKSSVHVNWIKTTCRSQLLSKLIHMGGSWPDTVAIWSPSD